MFGLVLAACSAEDADGEKEVAKHQKNRKQRGTGTDEEADDGPKTGGTVTGAMHTAPQNGDV